MAAARNSIQSMAGRNIDFASSASNGQRPGVVFPDADLKNWCRSEDSCDLQDSITPVMAYFGSASAHTAVTADWPNVVEAQTSLTDVTEFAVVSGILEAQLDTRADEPLCSAQAQCTMRLSIPVDNSAWSGSKSTMCARLQPASASGDAQTRELPYTALLDASIEPIASGRLDSPDMVTCLTDHLGKHLIVQFNSPDSGAPEVGATPPNPPSDPTDEVDVQPVGDAPPPPPDSAAAEPADDTPPLPESGVEEPDSGAPGPDSGAQEPDAAEEPAGRSGNTTVEFTVTVEADFSDVTANATIMAEFKNDITRAAAENMARDSPDLLQLEDGSPCYECVKAGTLEPGSVKVPLTVTLPDGTDEAATKEFEETIKSDVDGTFLDGSGYVVTDVIMPEDDDDVDNGNQDSAVIGGAVGGAVGGTIFIASIAAVAFYVHKIHSNKAAKQRTKPGTIAPELPSMQSMHEEPSISGVKAPSSALTGPAARQPVPLSDLEEGGRGAPSAST
ncbi:hypothetical protein DUNSADRAFT_10564 [Dunaliella salina]|uniref:Uncharacterized protein n=1 Tax=Dunaliella salina TaxID=3046 RepID=A0ABQ7H4Y2_DUNSA|nr:hypothetical protein DUNSADRAFT_10564 [Dunaliella salina]|eukprot:KAF5841858.1 hypothetical protein DUNSADRAFT_10564 [Dunaliella salina]